MLTDNERRLSWKLFATVFLTYSVFTGFVGWLDASGLGLTRSIGDSFSLQTDDYFNQTDTQRFHEFTGDRAFYKGHYYTLRPPLPSVLAVPAYVAWRIAFSIATGKDVARKALPSQDYAWVILVSVMSTSCLCGALLSLLIYDSSRHFISPVKWRVATTLAFAFATLIFNYSTIFFSHIPAAFFSFLAFHLLNELEAPGGRIKIKGRPRLTALLSGLALGAAVHSHYMAAGLLPAFFLLILFSARLRGLFGYWLGGSFIMALLLGLYFYEIFGSPFVWPYSYTDQQIQSESEALHRSEAQGGNGGNQPESSTDIEKVPPEADVSRSRQSGPSSKGIGYHVEHSLHRASLQRIQVLLPRLLFYPFRGLLFYNPFLLLCFAGFLPLAIRSSRLMFFCLFAFLGTLYLNLAHSDWWGGLSFGPRYLVPTIPFLFVPLMALLSKVLRSPRRRVWLIFAAFLLSLNMLCTAAGLQRWEYLLEAPGHSHAAKMRAAYEQHASLILEFAPRQSPLFVSYFPRLVSGGVKSVVPQALFGKAFDFPYNVLLLLALYALIWRSSMSVWLRRLWESRVA